MVGAVGARQRVVRCMAGVACLGEIFLKHIMALWLFVEAIRVDEVVVEINQVGLHGGFEGGCCVGHDDSV